MSAETISRLTPGRDPARMSYWAPQHSVSFVMPAFNEEDNILEAIRSTVSVGMRYCSEFEVLVVDDGSVDATAKLVEEASAQFPQVRLLRHATNQGYGQALHTGFEAAGLGYVFFTDADNQFDMEELPLLLMWADTADVVAGYRKVRQDAPMRLLNAWAWNRLVRMLFYVPVRDIDCAFKLFRRSALDQVKIESRGAMINTEIMVKLARAGCCFLEVGVTHRPRLAGSAHGAKVSVILRALREVAQMYPRLKALGASPEAVIDLRVADEGAVGSTNGKRQKAVAAAL